MSLEINIEYKINNFIKKNPIHKDALEKIINSMLETCRYINNESLERHNWGDKPKKLKNIPKKINLKDYEKDLLSVLDQNESIDKSIIELLWGDIQLGKRVHACIIMWFSIYILRRPVLYIFRNLEIDQKQLQEDIMGTEESSFNTQFIKNNFKEFNDKIKKEFNETETEYCDHYKDFVLPELKDINSGDVLNKLGNKEAIKPNDIFCCLMNYKQLEKINQKFNEYISNNEELIDMTILIDESDLMAPSSSNDNANKNDDKDSTQCEKLLAKIYKKVKYVLHITGTAHSLLYNITTKLFDDDNKKSNYTQLKISKVHKMKRGDNYYGLFNNNITFNTNKIESWWNNINDQNKKNKYTIEEDYNINIKKIIKTIRDRKANMYNSLLISEEKIRINQFGLVDKIIADYGKMFIIIFHGNCLRLYFYKKYTNKIIECVKYDNEISSTLRLYQKGGIFEDKPIFKEKSKKLENKYCYYHFDTKKINIKMIYKLLKILFEKYDKDIKYKTVITITGKYGERGYSFTSDDFNKYSFHLTDQYFLSHSTFNCTDISQRLRIQGKYNDIDLKNGKTKLTLWTTKNLEDVIKNFYIKFIKEIEQEIMNCNNWVDIKDLIESIIDNSELKLGMYMKYIDVAKKRKNINIDKKYEKENDGYKLIKIDDMIDDEIKKWCEKYNLPEYVCVNEIKHIENHLFKKNYLLSPHVPIKINLKNIDEIINNNKKLTKKNNINIFNLIKNELPDFLINFKLRNKSMIFDFDNKYPINKIINSINNNVKEYPTTNCGENEYEIFIICNDIKEFESKKGDCYIKYYTNEMNILEQLNIHKNPIYNNNIFIKHDNVIKYSVNNDFNELPQIYYWKTPDGWLYLNNNENKQIVSLKIIEPKIIKLNDENIDKNVKMFMNEQCLDTVKKNLRYGINDIYENYIKWCDEKKIKDYLNLNIFKEEFEKGPFKKEISKGINIDNKPGKRGYNLLIKYDEKKINNIKLIKRTKSIVNNTIIKKNIE